MFQVELFHVIRADFGSTLIRARHRFGCDRESSLRFRGVQVIQDDLHGFKWHAGPVFGDFAEQAVFDRIPFGGSTGIVCNGDGEMKWIYKVLLH